MCIRDREAPELIANHRTVVESWFAQDGVDLEERRRVLEAAEEAIGLECIDVGATNRNEKGELIYNQCFYLSIARSYLVEPSRELVEETALHLKRVIEACLLYTSPSPRDS
eukprot:TRINITY_DN40143_c0_g1_i1.p1 TRINITY_DN40143_c0_g1~~TRINITY_DN40143_c0_g1_i1.p1  ORF type:complete len:111 (+),score=41.34 TRINITY_DN40143_c0_g1_i1:61-393(+)